MALWQALFGEEQPPTVFVGHSMGGAIATWAASRQVGCMHSWGPSKKDL